jgi:superfamily II DNA/RNA helicase
MHQGARNRTLNSLRRGQVKVLVATDVAARGIDVPNITHVVNYDLPKFAEDYVHRIGRTGRAGRNGIAISLVNHAESMQVRRIERFTKQTIPVDVIAGMEPKRSAAPRSAARPGWKPGAGRNDKKPGQRSFGSSEGQRSYGNGDSQRSFGGQAEGYRGGDRPQRSGEGFRAADRPQRSGEGYKGTGGGYKGSHPRSTDSARRNFRDF